MSIYSEISIIRTSDIWAPLSLFFNVVEDLHINVCVSGTKRYILLLKLILFNNRYGALYIDKDIDDQCIFQLFKGESHLCLCECKCALM